VILRLSPKTDPIKRSRERANPEGAQSCPAMEPMSISEFARRSRLSPMERHLGDRIAQGFRAQAVLDARAAAGTILRMISDPVER
jgi:hypothetical protein